MPSNKRQTRQHGPKKNNTDALDFFQLIVKNTRNPECFEGVDAGEGLERGGEFGREANGGNGAVGEGKGVEGLEGSEGESDVVWGAVGEGKGEEVAEGLGGVAEGGVVLALAGVLGGWDVEGLKGSQLLWVKRGGRRRRWRRRRWRGSGREGGREGDCFAAAAGGGGGEEEEEEKN